MSCITFRVDSLVLHLTHCVDCKVEDQGEEPVLTTASGSLVSAFPNNLAQDETTDSGLGRTGDFRPGRYAMTQAVDKPTGENPVAEMTGLVTEIARALVDDPAAVSVEAIVDGDSTVIRLRVSHSDIGKVIGKQGRTARSMRTILSAASMKLKHRFALDIVEEGNSTAAQ